MSFDTGKLSMRFRDIGVEIDGTRGGLTRLCEKFAGGTNVHPSELDVTIGSSKVGEGVARVAIDCFFKKADALPVIGFRRPAPVIAAAEIIIVSFRALRFGSAESSLFGNGWFHFERCSDLLGNPVFDSGNFCHTTIEIACPHDRSVGSLHEPRRDPYSRSCSPDLPVDYSFHL